MSRNDNNLLINFCTTGTFKNLTKIKFIQKQKKFNNKTSFSNISENHSIKEDEITKKDELIKQLQEKIIFLENKIKFLEQEKIKNLNRSRNGSLNNTLVLKTEKSFSYKTNKATIPLDIHFLKEKLKRKNNLFELINVHNLNKKNKENEFKSNKKNWNNSLTSYNTRKNSSTNSELKPKKKCIRLNNINSFHKSLYSVSLKNSKKIISCSIEQKKDKNKKIKDKKNLNRKINDIPKKGRIKQNTTLKLMMSSTNYSNNISNISKEENATLKKNNSTLKNEIIIKDNNNNSFNNLKIKLENIKNRTKKLLDLYSLLNLDKINNSGNNKKQNNNKDKMKDTSHKNYIKIFKLEKIK